LKNQKCESVPDGFRNIVNADSYKLKFSASSAT
jgi:hypothetical protein